MRTFVAVLAGLVTLLVAVATVPLLWLSAHVDDEDGYVAFSSELAADTQLQSAFADVLAADLVARGLLPQRLEETAVAAMGVAAGQVTSTPGFTEAWEQTQRSLHHSALHDDSGPITLDLSPSAELVAQAVGDRLPVSLQVPSGLTVPVAAESDRDRLVWVGRSTTLGLLGLVAVIVAASTTLLASRSRWIGLAGLGVVALATAGILRVLTEAVVPAAIDRAEGSTEFARILQKLLLDRAASSLSGWLGWIALGGAIALVVGVAGRLVGGRATPRTS